MRVLLGTSARQCWEAAVALVDALDWARQTAEMQHPTHGSSESDAEPPRRRSVLGGVVGTVLGVSWALVERRRADRRRRERESLLQTAVSVSAEQAELHRIAILVAGGASADAVCGAVAVAAAALYDAQVALVAHLSTSGQAELRGLCMSAPVDGYPAVGEHLNFTPSSAIGRLVDTQKTTRVQEGTSSPFADDLGQRVAAPIRLSDGLWGVLAIGAAPNAVLADGVEDQLEGFAELVALAIGNAETRDQLIRQATTDPLTGLANRRAFHAGLDQEIKRAVRHGRPLCLALIDIDHFKAVNDSLGHLLGDEVLAEVAARLRASVRTEAVFARIGGDELAVILPETSLAEAEEVAQRIQTIIRSEPFIDDLVVTVSIGVAQLASDGDANSLRGAADGALYRAKNAGRGRVISSPL
jgi:diguanylate cyclase (GGDEF)-like protein